jgi:hypothetical protein
VRAIRHQPELARDFHKLQAASELLHSDPLLAAAPSSPSRPRTAERWNPTMIVLRGAPPINAVPIMLELMHNH